MLDINIEFYKGVLFVRLNGVLKEENFDNLRENITSILNKSGIKYLVFNILNLKIEDDRIFSIVEKQLKLNNGKMFICGNKLLKYPILTNELNALKEIESC